MRGAGTNITPGVFAPGAGACHEDDSLDATTCGRRRLRRDYFAMSLRALRGRTLMTRRAGLALNICSCLVNGLMPMRALVAGFWMTVIFMRPGTTKVPGPFFPTWFLI